MHSIHPYRAAPLALICAALVACTSAPATTPAPVTPGPGHVSKAEFGSRWPFSVSEGTLACYDGAAAGGNGRILVTFSTGNGIEFGVNGSALDFGFPDFDKSILPAYPNKAGLTPLIERGLTLC